jgi:toxin ParE1/3/4
LNGCGGKTKRVVPPSFTLSKFVEPELEAISALIALYNPDAADRFTDRAYQTIELLARYPEMGPSRNFMTAKIPGLRSFRVKDFENYLIFYRPSADGIQVLHVFHGARDLEALLRRERTLPN